MYKQSVIVCEGKNIKQKLSTNVVVFLFVCFIKQNNVDVCLFLIFFNRSYFCKRISCGILNIYFDSY